MLISTITVYNIAEYINPQVAVTEEDQRYMPFHNVTESVFFGILAAVLVFYTSTKALIQRKKNKYPFDQTLREQDF